tara:strand:- start:1499 stop:2131 length:633 start_codon:yes stop_codon:yes gene_type:complete
MSFSLPKAINAAYFDKSCEIEGDSGWAASRWETAEDQEVRFSIIENAFDFRNASVLDVGCGQGDLFHHLFKYKIDYTGIDASPKMVEHAKAKPVRWGEKGEFIEVDLLNFKKENSSYDYVVACGLFSIQVGDNSLEQYHYIQSSINKMFEMCRVGFFVNFLSTEVHPDFRHDEFFYYDPVKILAMCNERTHKISYDHTTYDHEFMISGYV